MIVGSITKAISAQVRGSGLNCITPSFWLKTIGPIVAKVPYIANPQPSEDRATMPRLDVNVVTISSQCSGGGRQWQ